MKRENIHKIIFLVSFWMLVALFSIFYDYAVIHFNPDVNTNAIIKEYNFASNLISVTVAALLGGTLLATIEVLYFNRFFRKIPFGKSMLIKSVFYMINIVFFTSLAVLIGNSIQYNKPLIHPEIVQMNLEFMSSPRLWTIWILWGLTVIFSLFILQISEKLGQGVLVNYLLGKYHQPREEVRIFMFLDLKSSTRYAEKLGHIKYSKLIQDCFYDLTEVVSKHDAQIYQYVGDEIVLTWKKSKGLKDCHCLRTFIDYKKALIRKKDYYIKSYGLLPEFKAGLDYGQITVAEVGEIKKELAYHGDVLNSAARIQHMCNEYQSSILLSERLKSQLAEDKQKALSLIGKMQLKGRSKKMNVYSYKFDSMAFSDN